MTIAIITGTSKGIGYDIATRLTQDERIKRIHCLARTKTNIQDEKIISHCVDISDFEDTRRKIESISQDERSINLLINSAGICTQKKFKESNFDTIQKEINVNLLGTMNIVHSVIPYLDPYAHIITIGSLMGRIASPSYSSYCASKFGLIGFSEALRLEHPEYKVSCVLPTLVKTGMIEDHTPISNWVYPIDSDYVAEKVLKLVWTHTGIKSIGVQAQLACIAERFSPFVKRFMLN